MEVLMEDIRKKIILVDDDKSILSQGRELLKNDYKVFPVPSAAELFELLEKVVPDLILLDIEMKEMDGFEAIKKLKADERYAKIPIIFLTAKSDTASEKMGLDLGAVDYVSKPFSAPIVIKRISNHLLIVSNTKALQESRARLQDYAENLEDMVHEKTAEVVELQDAVISTVADLVEFRDDSTGGHTKRTQLYYKALVDWLIQNSLYSDTISNWDLEHLFQSVQLHDLGKIGISDLILNKTGNLTLEEFEIMKGHVAIGVSAIERIMDKTSEHSFLDHALLVVGAHHEKWDGSGYPKGLKGNDIPLEGRLMAIADVYDALVSERPYKKKLPHEVACMIIVEGAGSHFDPLLVDAFSSVNDEFKQIALEN
jgi:putative two-component system response regulator